MRPNFISFWLTKTLSQYLINDVDLFFVVVRIIFVQFKNKNCLARTQSPQIDLARPNAMYAANSMYIANSATGVTISHPGQFPPPPAVFANRPTINLINASNDTTNDGNKTITTTANSGIGTSTSGIGNANKRDISTDTTVSNTFLYNLK